jgi:hypothetical protein
VSTSDDQRQAEMARGKEIAARHAAIAKKPLEERREIIARYEAIVQPKTGVMATAAQHYPFKLVFEGKNKVAYLNDEQIAAEVYGPSFPSDVFTCQCILAVNSLIPPEWVPDYSPEKQAAMNERKRRDEARSHVIDWKKYINGY